MQQHYSCIDFHVAKAADRQIERYYRMLPAWFALLVQLHLAQPVVPDILERYQQAIKKDDRDNYVLSFEVTYPRMKQNDEYEKIKQDYLIKVRGDERYSTITQHFQGKQTVTHQFILPTFIIYYDPRAPYIDYYTQVLDEHLNHTHNVNYRKLGRLSYSLGASDSSEIANYLKLFDNKFARTVNQNKQIEYKATLHKGTAEYKLIFDEANASYPVETRIFAKYGTGTTQEDILKVTCLPKSFPTRIETLNRINGELISHRIINNIKIAPLPADFVFTPTLMNIPVNSRGLQDNNREVFWDGRKFTGFRVLAK